MDVNVHETMILVKAKAIYDESGCAWDRALLLAGTRLLDLQTEDSEAYRRRVLVEESDVEGITLGQAAMVAERRGWKITRAVSGLPVAISQGFTNVVWRHEWTHAMTASRVANAVAHRATDDACPLDIVDEMRREVVS